MNISKYSLLNELSNRYNWSNEEKRHFEEIFNEFDKDQKLTYSGFEHRLRKELGTHDFVEIECIYHIILKANLSDNTIYPFIRRIPR